MLAPVAAALMSGVLLLATPMSAASMAWSAPDIQVEVSPREGEVNLIMQIKVKVTGEEGADCQMLATPVVDGARLQRTAGPNHYTTNTFHNNRWTKQIETSWEFVLVPERPGVIVVPPFRLECRGVTVSSQPVKVPVKNTAVPVDAVRLLVQPSTTDLWLGQRFTIGVVALVDEEWTDRIVQGGMHLTLAWYDGLGGLMRLADPPSNVRSGHIYLNGSRNPIGAQVGRREYDGRAWLAYQLVIPMLAVQAGTVTLPASHYSVNLATEIRQQRDPFDLFGGRRSVASRIVEAGTSAAAITITVREPPDAGRPSSYTNAVGLFELAGAAAPRSLRVGETCTLSLRLVGEGNLEFVEWPDFDELLRDFRIFGKEEARDAHALRLAIEISPKHDRVSQVPELSFAVFDVEQEAYEVLTVGPFDLDVESGGDAGLVDILQEPDEVLNDLETIRETLPPPRHQGAPDWIWFVPGLLLLLGVDIGQRLSRWRRTHPEQVARRGARARLVRSLDQAAAVRDVAVAFSKFLADRLGGPPAGMTLDEALEALPPAAADDAHLVGELRKIVGRWEAAYLGGSAYDLDQATTEARALVRMVEQAT